MRRFAVPAAVALLLLSSCAPPARDNPFDPADGHIPSVSLTEFVVEADGSTHAGVEGGRQSTFHVDANAVGAPGETFTYSWEVSRTDCSSDAHFQPNSAESSAHLSTPLLLTSDMLPASGVGVGIWNVCVRVRDGSTGPSTIGTTQLVVHNNAPSLPALEDYFISTANLPTDVVLDACGRGRPGTCPQLDPDSDVLTFTWTQLSGTPVSFTNVDVDGRRIHFQPTASPTGYRFRVTASDQLASTTRDVSVWADSPLWYTTDSPTRLFRVYPEFRRTQRYHDNNGAPQTWSSQVTDAAVDPANGTVWVTDGGGSTHHLDASSSELSAPFTAGGFASGTVAVAGPNLCVAGYSVSTGSGLYFLKSSNGSTNKLLVSTTIYGTDRVVPDGAGGCWTYIQNTAQTFELGHVNASGVYAAIADNLAGPLNSGSGGYPFQYFVASADGGAWLETDYDYLGGAPCYGLCRISPAGVLTQVGSSQYDGLMLDVDGVTPLVHDYSVLGIFAMSTNGMETRSTLPLTMHPGPASTDLAAGALWFADDTGLLFRCTKDATGDYAPCTSLLADDADGSVGTSWASVAADPATSSAVTVLPTSTGVVVATIPPHLRQRDFVPLSVATIGDEPRLSADPATGDGWYSDRHNVVGAVGMEKFTATGVVVLGTAGTQSFVDDIVATRDGGAWGVVYPQGGPNALFHMDGSGDVDRTIPLAAGDTVQGIGVGPDGTLCVGTENYNSGTEALWRMHSGASSLTSLGSGYYTTSYGVNVAVPGDGSCWFGGGETSTGFSYLRLLHFAPSSTTPDADRTEAYTNRYVYNERIAADPRDNSVWVPAILATGTAPDYFLERITTAANGTLAESYTTTSGWTQPIFAIAMRARCAAANNPSCLEAWELTGGPTPQLLRTNGHVDQPLESTPLGGAPSSLSLAP